MKLIRYCAQSVTMGIVAILFLGACQQTPPKPTPPGLTAKQVAALHDAGFHQTSDGWEIAGNEKILFGHNVGELDSGGREIVSRIGRALLAVDIRQVQVLGFTDNTGTPEYNRKLSKRRAEAVAAVLAGIGMRSQDIDAEGMGDKDPVASNATAEGRAQNRRVAIVVSSP
jgi:OOP family OmpA-OmpF porin